jgi:formate--tetrahydrofolate ligase
VQVGPSVGPFATSCRRRPGPGWLPVCIATTHLSVSSDPELLGSPHGRRLPVREARADVGAGFARLVSGDMRTTPGLSPGPAAERIDIDENGDVAGLY